MSQHLDSMRMEPHVMIQNWICLNNKRQQIVLFAEQVCSNYNNITLNWSNSCDTHVSYLHPRINTTTLKAKKHAEQWLWLERTKGTTRRIRKQSLLVFGKWIIDGNNLLLQLWLVGSYKFVKLSSLFKKEESWCSFDVPWSAELLQHMQWNHTHVQ